MRDKKSSLFIRMCAAVMIGAISQAAQAQVVLPDRLVDAAEVTTGWTSHNTLSADTQIKVIGAASLKSVGSGLDRFRKAFSTPIDVSKYRYLTFWYYVDRPDLIITPTGSASDAGQIELTSSGTFDRQEWNWSVLPLRLQRGWNYVVLDLPGKTRDAADPLNTASVNYLRIYHRPRASVTTRIDHIVFTNREPQSFAFADFLEQKRISRSTTAVEQLDETLAFVLRTTPGTAARAKSCRRLRMDLTQREINGFTLQSMGVTPATVDNEIRAKRLLKEFMCGERTMARTELLGWLQQRAITEVALVAELAALFDLSAEAAAESRLRSLDVDLRRIMSTCGARPVEVDNYINTGALPPTVFPGANVLVQNCSGTAAQIAVSMSSGAPPVFDRRVAYRQCMAAFEQQGAECDNAFANPDDDYERALRKVPNITEEEVQRAKKTMEDTLRAVRDLSLEDARDRRLGGETHAGPLTDPEDLEVLEDLHENYDVVTGKIASVRIVSGMHQGSAEPELLPDDLETPQQRASRVGEAEATLRRLHAEEIKLGEEQIKILLDICTISDWEDPLCDQKLRQASNSPANSPPATSPTRCASMSLDSTNIWFDRPPGASGRAGQINEADRIDHCLCELFDRNYNASLPGNIVPLTANCPTPEERLAQKCLENPYSFDGPIDPGTGGGTGGKVRLECRHLMQPISMDRDALAGKLCDKMMPNCLNDAVMNATTGSCSCPTRAPSGTLTHPSCTSIPNCTDGVVVTSPLGFCLCQSFDSGANACMKGGKDFYLTRDAFNDLKVRDIPGRPAIAGVNLLVPRTGKVSVVTPAIKRSQLFNDRLLTLRAVLPGTVDNNTGQMKVYCTKTATFSQGRIVPQVMNRLIETVPLSSLSTSAPSALAINLDADERDACYGTAANNNTHFEFLFETDAAQPVAVFDILGELGNIKPPCIQTPRPNSPVPGPRLLNNWISQWILSDGTRINSVFEGTGTMPVSPPPISFPVCLGPDGIPMLCP